MVCGCVECGELAAVSSKHFIFESPEVTTLPLTKLVFLKIIDFKTDALFWNHVEIDNTDIVSNSA